MLPRLLCEELCSLHPGYPRFAFSIVWEVDEDGNIYKEWAGRSVISSRAKLAYPMVQQMIEGCFDPAPWGVRLHEGATWEEVRTVLLGGDLSLVMCPMQLFLGRMILGWGPFWH
jgi:DIS3-like exonuclease 2